MKYWLREPYLGFGADAHGFDGTHRMQNAELASDYVRDPASSQILADTIGERFFLGLRLMRGIEPPFTPFEPQISDLISRGLLEVHNHRLRLTPRGVMLSNEVFAEFVEVPAQL
jgi:oxygen-independent coproporphyrinogen-3 oxidase